MPKAKEKPSISPEWARLADQDDVFTSASADDDFKTLNDGEYTLFVSRSFLEEADWGIQWVIEARNDQGSIRKWHTLEPDGTYEEREARMGYIKRDSIRLGFRGENMVDLVAWIEAGGPLDACFEGKVQTKNEKKRLYINKSVDMSVPDHWRGPEQYDQPAPAASDEDIPF